MMRILGIDPGSQKTGVAILQYPKPQLLYANTIVLTNRKQFPTLATKMEKLYKEIAHLIQTYQPHILAIESPFYGQNAQSMLKLGHIQGLCFALAFQYRLSFHTYTPTQIKQAITGHGNASKEQVQGMLQYHFPDNTHLSLPSFDASDAIAVALTHAFFTESPLYPLRNR